VSGAFPAELGSVPAEGKSVGSCVRRDHESGCRSRMSKRSEGGVAVGKFGKAVVVDAISSGIVEDYLEEVVVRSHVMSQLLLDACYTSVEAGACMYMISDL
jgi:hypothetical protein